MPGSPAGRRRSLQDEPLFRASVLSLCQRAGGGARPRGGKKSSRPAAVFCLRTLCAGEARSALAGGSARRLLFRRCGGPQRKKRMLQPDAPAADCAQKGDAAGGGGAKKVCRQARAAGFAVRFPLRRAAGLEKTFLRISGGARPAPKTFCGCARGRPRLFCAPAAKSRTAAQKQFLCRRLGNAVTVYPAQRKKTVEARRSAAGRHRFTNICQIDCKIFFYARMFCDIIITGTRQRGPVALS